jgi:erythromycin esterase
MHLGPRLAVAAILGLALSATGVSQDQSVVEWIRANAIRLNTADPGRGFGDMQRLKQVIGDARIVALGEATHGSREFFTLKHRVVEFLASELGFTIFAIEANIANQNPKAKIVLWAHNGHVSAGGFGGQTMGSVLRKTFGDRMIVFGFAFGSGSFQAVAAGLGVPRPMTVPPAPDGSLDRTLSAAGIPLFALDLRRAPAWFGSPRPSRQIGAVYPDGDPHAFMVPLVAPEAFDAILFVDKTTTAVKNP